MKVLLLLFASFNLLSAENTSSPAVSNGQVQTYFVEGQYEGSDGTVYYKAQQVEIYVVDGSGQKAQSQAQAQGPKPYVEQKNFVNQITPSPEFHAFVVNDESNGEHALFEKKPYVEQKDFVNNSDNSAKFYLVGMGQPNASIEWIYGNKSTEISFAYAHHEWMMYKTTTYTMAVKPTEGGGGGHTTPNTNSNYV